ncbi:24951_t:CDS:10 [Dentiscutata erythropus]|uniref:24951_t:CDS:1 n=1 Tax=Dentiscutata erythropus TaxID=1348616 RepID=A0A9N9EUJ3_9GLOM|nr:24951_t:CDS:10 [Dentiscutata erythropus]
MSTTSLASPFPPETVINCINFQETVQDTPHFRASIRRFEEHIDHFEKWLDSFLKALKQYIEEINKFNDASNTLAKRSSLTEDSWLDSEFTLPSVRLFTDIFQTTFAFKAKLANDIDEKILQPINQFMKNDLKEFKEIRRAYDKSLDKYDNTLAKYASQSKTKEASALREDAFQLFEIRKTYIKTALDYTLKTIQFKSALDHFLMDQFLGGICAHLEFHDSCLMIYKGSENSLNRLKGWLCESKKTCENQMPVLQDLRKKLEEDAINMTKPRRKLTKYTDHAIQHTQNSSQSNRPPSPSVNLADIPPKQGYLFMKPLNGKSNWTKKYFYLKNGIFWWASVGSGKHRSTIEESERIGVLLCEVKIDTSQDRRFCFEVVCGAKQTSYVLQAETETELKDWISTFEAAKRHAFRSSNDLATSAAAAVSPHKELEDEQNQPTTDEEQHNDDVVSKSGGEGSQPEASDTKSIIPSLSSSSHSSDLRQNSLNVPNITNRKRSSSIPNPPKPPLVSNYSSPSKIPGTHLNPNNTGNLVAPLASQGFVNEKNTNSGQHNFWGTLQQGFMPAMNLLINTVNSTEGEEEGDETNGRKRSSSFRSKGGRSRSGSGPVGFGADGSIAVYPQILFLHNMQLHFLFPNSTEREFVLDVYNCAWKRDNVLLKGRVYITQDNIYFYSIVMSTVNMFFMSWQDIKSITQETTNILQTIEFSNENESQKYVLQTFMESSNELYDKAHLIWKLATSEKSSTLQEMYDAVWKDHTLLHSKESGEVLSDKDAEFHKEDFSINLETPPEKDAQDLNDHSDSKKALDAVERKDDQAKSDSDKVNNTPPPASTVSKPQEGSTSPNSITNSSPIRTTHGGHASTLRRRAHRVPKRKPPTSDDNSVPGGSSSTSLNNEEKGKLFIIISTIVEIVSSLSFNTLFGTILILSLALNIYIWFSTGQLIDSTSTIQATYESNPITPAVYLRDLEEHILNKNTRMQHPPYPWLLYSNRRLSEEIIISRKKVAMLRYDLLLAFRNLNLVDKRLLESEYINWLLDEKAKCNKARWLLLKDDLIYEDEDTVEEDDCINCVNSSTIIEQANSNGTNMKDERKYSSEYKAISKYCGDVKKQLDVMPTTF